MMLGIITMVALIGAQGTPATPTTPATKQTSSAAVQAPAVAPKDADILIKDALADAKKGIHPAHRARDAGFARRGVGSWWGSREIKNGRNWEREKSKNKEKALAYQNF